MYTIIAPHIDRLRKTCHIDTRRLEGRQQGESFLSSYLAIDVFIVVFVKRCCAQTVAYPEVDGVRCGSEALGSPRYVLGDVRVKCGVLVSHVVVFSSGQF